MTQMEKHMTTPVSTKTVDASLERDLLYAVRYYLGGRRSMFLLATLAILAGLGFNWNWLVAAGIAPILLAALPCLVMCGLGLCINKLIGSSCAPAQEQSTATEPTQPEVTTSVVNVERASPGASACCHVDSGEATSTDQSLGQRRDTHV